MIGLMARFRGRWLCGVGVLAVATGCAHGVVATDRTVGTAAQFDSRFSDIADDGSWVVLGQADDVDAPLEDRPFEVHPQGPVFGLKLFLGDQAGIPIDDHLASSDDRWLVVEREGRLELLDVPAARWVELASAELERISVDYDQPVELTDRTALMWGSARCFTDFSANGSALLFLDPGEGANRLVVQRLEDGTRHVLELGPGVLSWARLMPAGDAVVVGMTVRDDGPAVESIAWPPPLDEILRCSQPSLVPDGARNVTRVLALDGKELGRRPGDYEPRGAGLFQPTKEGGFTWWRPDLDRDTAVPVCAGVIFHADPVVPRILALCDSDGKNRRSGDDDYMHGRLRLERFEDREDLGPADLEWTRPRTDANGRFVGMRGPEGILVVDMETGRRIALPEGQIVTIAAGRALVQSGRRSARRFTTRVRIVDLQSLATLETYWVRVWSYEGATGPGPVVVHRRRVIDLETAEVLGKLPVHPFWVTSEGLVLMVDPETRQPRRRALPRGPLRWYEVQRGL
jgi:hypothetical protein